MGALLAGIVVIAAIVFFTGFGAPTSTVASLAATAAIDNSAGALRRVASGLMA